MEVTDFDYVEVELDWPEFNEEMRGRSKNKMKSIKKESQKDRKKRLSNVKIAKVDDEIVDEHWNFVHKNDSDLNSTPGFEGKIEIDWTPPTRGDYVAHVISSSKTCDPIAWKKAHEYIGEPELEDSSDSEEGDEKDDTDSESDDGNDVELSKQRNFLNLLCEKLENSNLDATSDDHMMISNVRASDAPLMRPAWSGLPCRDRCSLRAVSPEPFRTRSDTRQQRDKTGASSEDVGFECEVLTAHFKKVQATPHPQAMIREVPRQGKSGSDESPAPRQSGRKR